MHIEFLRDYCLNKPGVTEDFPFDEKVLVFKVAGKVFLLTDIETFCSINVKCDPERAVELREQFSAVKPGYHMNKKHWNTLRLDENLTDNFLIHEIEHSYNLVLAGLPQKTKLQLKMASGDNGVFHQQGGDAEET